MIDLNQELERIKEELKTEKDPMIISILCTRGIEIAHILNYQNHYIKKIQELFNLPVDFNKQKGDIQ